MTSALLLSATVLAREIEVEPHFRGTCYAFRYMNHLLLSPPGRWDKERKYRFVKRMIEAERYDVYRGYYGPPLLSEAELRSLRLPLPPLKGVSLETCTVIGLGRYLGKHYPEIARAASKKPWSRVSFWGEPSPAAWLDERYWLEKPPSRQTWLRLISNGSRWEAAHPDLDYALRPDSAPVLAFQKMFGAKVVAGDLGVRIRDMQAALKRRGT